MDLAGSDSSASLNGLRDWEQPTVINIDKAPTYGIVILELKAEVKCAGDLAHRHVKCPNNAFEADHATQNRL